MEMRKCYLASVEMILTHLRRLLVIHRQLKPSKRNEELSHEGRRETANYSPSCGSSMKARSSKFIWGVYFKACRQHVLITKQGYYAILLS